MIKEYQKKFLGVMQMKYSRVKKILKSIFSILLPSPKFHYLYIDLFGVGDLPPSQCSKTPDGAQAHPS